ncbi:MAG: Glu-tRNA(Gln) amidotransferase subunit GatD, partial [Thermoplasmata archaeon]
DREGPIRIRPVFDRLSENLVPQDWEILARHVVEVFHEGAQGVVVAHGTDTLGFTAAGLSFLLEDLPGPVVLTGAQRSPDRPSSDGVSNLHSAVRVARHPRLAEVVVVMHDGLSDDRFAIHRGTRVRKMHSSRRDAFRSLNGPPIGFAQPGGIELAAPFRERSEGPARFAGPLGLDAGLLWSYPGLEADRARAFVQQLRGVVLAGTGLGHIASAHIPWISEATAKGIVVVMTTQCLEGNVDPFVYETGRELVKAGVLYVRDMLPEVAYAKLLWALGRSRDRSEVHFLMLKDRAGELSDRHVVGESS